MATLELVQLSSLEKVFLNRPIEAKEFCRASALQGEEFAYQIAYRSDCKMDLSLSVDSSIADDIQIYEIGTAPSQLPAYPDSMDENYITREPGLFPDILNPLNPLEIKSVSANRAIWINVTPSPSVKAGVYPITIVFKNEELGVCESKTFHLELIDASLPEQTLIFTQWFHSDCIATYYKEEVFSESHWLHIENFLRTAADHGINMILTPLFTPPLDTAIGGERPTVQLVDVTKSGGKYSFQFSKLKRWIDLCKKCKIKYFEMSHFFTQWGAKYTPKIIAQVDGECKRIFGWDVAADSSEYKEFLDAFLPELVQFLKTEQIEGYTYFHVSDEPQLADLESYQKAYNLMKPHLKGFKIIDALSNYEFYRSGAVEHPIPALNHIQPFLEVDDLWTYYCCSQGVKVSNRFFAMPSYRNRILGLQLYQHNITGFLQWGYNFYYSQCSQRPINPYVVTDADYAFPSGDAFSVYPGDDGTAIPSLRLKVFLHGLQDIRALQLLETKLPREAILTLLRSQGALSFEEYPNNADFILAFREQINGLIKALF